MLTLHMRCIETQASAIQIGHNLRLKTPVAHPSVHRADVRHIHYDVKASSVGCRQKNNIYEGETRDIINSLSD